MKLSQTVCSLAIAALAGFAGVAHAQWKPTKPIEVIVHTAPGGGNDLLARAMVQMLEKEKLLPVRMQVLNRPGGNGAVAAAAIAEKKGDPHTLGLVSTAWIANALVTSEAKVTLHDLTPVSGLLQEPALIAVRSDSPFKTLKEFIEAAKAKPGTLKQSGGSVTSRDNVVRQTLQQISGAKWAFVSFQGGGERLAALLGGHVDIMVIEPQEAGEQIRAGKLRVLAQISNKPLVGFSNIPNLKQAGFDISTTPQIRAVMAPPDFPKEALAYYEDLFSKLSKSASWNKYVEEYQLEDNYMNGAALGKSITAIESDLKNQYQQAGVKTVR
jgi:putative tricarboxylic transport membrane protein